MFLQHITNPYIIPRCFCVQFRPHTFGEFRSYIKFCTKMLIYFSCVHGHSTAKQLYENMKVDSLKLDSPDKVNFSFILNLICNFVTLFIEDSKYENTFPNCLCTDTV